MQKLVDNHRFERVTTYLTVNSAQADMNLCILHKYWNIKAEGRNFRKD